MNLATLAPRLDDADRRHAARHTAEEFFSHKPDWVSFFREILGVDGLVSRLFPTPEELAAFERTDEYRRIQQMLRELRQRPAADDDREPLRMITVRLPKSLHEALKTEAYDRATSMNQLCISKLLQLTDVEGIGQPQEPAQC
jgi:hypothetical protein